MADPLFDSKEADEKLLRLSAAAEREQENLARIPELIQKVDTLSRNLLTERSRVELLVKKIDEQNILIKGFEEIVRQLVNGPPAPPVMRRLSKHLAVCNRCSENIYWTRTDRGANMPLDFDTVKGTIIPQTAEGRAQVAGKKTSRGYTEDARFVSIVVEDVPGAVEIYPTHFIKCPQ